MENNYFYLLGKPGHDSPQKEWVAYDSTDSNMITLQAENAEKAFRKAVERGVIPRKNDDIRPRQQHGEVMTKQRFAELYNDLVK